MFKWGVMGAALLLCVSSAWAQEAGQRQPGEYPFTEDSLVQDGVPKGDLKGPFEFHSKVFDGTVRRYWVYVPHEYDASNPPY